MRRELVKSLIMGRLVVLARALDLEVVVLPRLVVSWREIL